MSSSTPSRLTAQGQQHDSSCSEIGIFTAAEGEVVIRIITDESDAVPFSSYIVQRVRELCGFSISNILEVSQPPTCGEKAAVFRIHARPTLVGDSEVLQSAVCLPTVRVNRATVVAARPTPLLLHQNRDRRGMPLCLFGAV